MTESTSRTLVAASCAVVIAVAAMLAIGLADVSGAQHTAASGPVSESGPVSNCSAKVEARGLKKDRLDIRISCRSGSNLTQIQVARIARAGGFGVIRRSKINARTSGDGSIRKRFRCRSEDAARQTGQISCNGDARGPLTVRASLWVAPRQVCRMAVRVRLKSLLRADSSAEGSVLPPPVIRYKVAYSRLPAGCR